MFTGIVTAIGTIREAAGDGRGGVRLGIAPPPMPGWDCAGIAIGASIACNGVCQTVVEAGDGLFVVDASVETMAVTTIGDWREGDAVNLERSLAAGDEMGGHMVSGHVDGRGEILAIKKDGGGHRLEVEAPAALAPLIAPKGSIAIDGVSLTVNAVEGARFGVMVIPHTWRNTTLGDRRPGDKINLEADMLARYVARIVSPESGTAGG